VFLNNRHYDPATGVFISVDPLVTMTGEPYIYGAANPVTMSDPSGLCAGSQVFDKCVLPDGKVLDQGTSRFRTPAEADFARTPPTGGASGPGLTLDDLTFDPQEFVDEILANSAGWLNPGSGVCTSAQGGNVVSAAGEVCVMFLNDEFVVAGSTAVGAGPNAELVGGVGVLITNAQNADDVRGYAVCGSGTAAFGGGVDVTACGGVTSSGVPTGVFSIVSSGVVGGGGGFALFVSESVVYFEDNGRVYRVIASALDRIRVGSAPPSWCTGGSLNAQADAMGNRHASSC